ncbi:hypothetical protein V8B97DRAFT_972357 [Scleroderma yunnanense]
MHLGSSLPLLVDATNLVPYKKGQRLPSKSTSPIGIHSDPLPGLSALSCDTYFYQICYRTMGTIVLLNKTSTTIYVRVTKDNEILPNLTSTFHSIPVGENHSWTRNLRQIAFVYSDDNNGQTKTLSVMPDSSYTVS